MFLSQRIYPDKRPIARTELRAFVEIGRIFSIQGNTDIAAIDVLTLSIFPIDSIRKFNIAVLAPCASDPHYVILHIGRAIPKAHGNHPTSPSRASPINEPS